MVCPGQVSAVDPRDAATGKVVAPFPVPDRQFIDAYETSLSPDGRIAIKGHKGDAVGRPRGPP